MILYWVTLMIHEIKWVNDKLLRIAKSFILNNFPNLQTNVCCDSERAWKSGDKALKSIFSANLLFDPDICPLSLVYNFYLAGHTDLWLFKKSFLYTVSKLNKFIPYWWAYFGSFSSFGAILIFAT